jgi:hypothetical protein
MSISEELDQALWADLRSETSFPTCRPLLAHYTSVDVLEKILVHNEMWFSNPLYMNDWEELEYGMNIGATEFRVSAHISDACASPETHQKLVGEFDRLFRDFDTKHAIDTYVLCFSEHSKDNDDGLLSMWRGYGAGGAGVALIIDTSKMRSIEQSSLILRPVRYMSHVERASWVDEKLFVLAEIIRAHPMTEDNLRYVAYYWIERLKLFSLFTKHNGFSEEREWRVVYMSERDKERNLAGMLGYLITARGVEPKLKLKLSEIPGIGDSSISIEALTDRIILGPSISTVMARTSICRMLELNGKTSLTKQLVESSIPYRP